MFNASYAKRGFILSQPPMGGLFRNVRQQAVKTILAILALVPLTGAAQLPDFTDLVEKQGATVVNISTTQTVRSPLGSQQAPQLQEDDPFYEFFRRFVPNPGPREFQNNSLGSGFIISTDGPEMLQTYIRDEFATLGRLGILSVEEQEQLAATAMAASFVPNVSDVAAAQRRPARREVVEREEA